MVLALQRLTVAARERHLPRPMAADVVEGVQLSVEGVGDHDRLVNDHHRHEVPDARELVGASNELPGAAKDPLHLAVVDRGVGVVARGERRGAGKGRSGHLGRRRSTRGLDWGGHTASLAAV